MSDVVKLYKEGSVGIISMEEKEHKNTFSHELVRGLIDAFETIKNNPEIKVVVIHGYENYFCCGGTRDELMELFEGINKEEGKGKVSFDDFRFYDLCLQCEVPVIAAMQGHSLGGGLAFGCYADIIVLAKECIYSANFMKYGFTPGMGATYIIPKKFGELLGNEMLFSAKNYYGAELQERGASVKVVTKTDVIKTAIDIAKELAGKPALSLKVLKKHLVDQTRADLPGVIKKELEMHKLTFAQPEVREKIEELFVN